MDVLNPGGNGGSSHSSIAPPPAVPGIMNPLPSQPFSGTLFVPQSTGGVCVCVCLSGKSHLFEHLS